MTCTLTSPTDCCQRSGWVDKATVLGVHGAFLPPHAVPHPDLAGQWDTRASFCVGYTRFLCQGGGSASIGGPGPPTLPSFGTFSLPTGTFCNGTFDRYVCWPHSSPGNVSVPCPSYLPWWREGSKSYFAIFFQFP